MTSRPGPHDRVRLAVARSMVAARDGADTAAAVRDWNDALAAYAATVDGAVRLAAEADLADRCGDTATAQRLRAALNAA